MSAVDLAVSSISDHPHFSHSGVSAENLVLLYPLHQTVTAVLHHLTTTSLLTAELQLLSISLTNLLILASSPQAQILKGLLWGGGLSTLLLCGAVIRWEIALARVPKWRFRRTGRPKTSVWKQLAKSFSWRRIKHEIIAPTTQNRHDDSPYSTEEEGGGGDYPVVKPLARAGTLIYDTRTNTDG